MRTTLPTLMAATLLGTALSLYTPLVLARDRTLSLSLSGVQKRVLQISESLAAARLARSAADSRTGAQYSLFFPKLGIDASARFVSNIPSLNVIPGRSIPFGDNQNYSVGLGLSWTLWDSGATYHSWKSALAIESQKTHEVRNAELQITLGVSIAYFKVLLASAQLNSVTEALELARAQYRDISGRFASGAASKVDDLSANREVLEFESKHLLAKSDLSRALHELFALVGDNDRYDLSNPATTALPATSIQNATLIVETEPLASALKAFDERHLTDSRPSPNHPRIAAWTQQVAALNQAADGVSAGHWPKVQVAARTSLDYPNGPNLELVQQNTVGATLTWSLFEAGRVSKETDEKRRLAEASDHRKAQAHIDMVRDWNDSRDQLRVLHEQQSVNSESLRESEQIAKLTYSSYRLGRTNFLDVQSANLRALNAKIQAAKTDIQVLIQLATLSSLVEGAGK
jgi:outer membrane protein TolC